MVKNIGFLYLKDKLDVGLYVIIDEFKYTLLNNQIISKSMNSKIN